MKTVIEKRPDRLAMRTACLELGLNRSSVYSRQKRAGHKTTPSKRSRKNSVQPRALSEKERARVMDTLHAEPYCDQAPAEVYQRLLEKNEYLCSVSTMHRLLRKRGENGERRAQRPAQHHAIPRLLAGSPNEVWTWDITKLPLIQGRIYLSLYVVLDLYSRFVVAWMISKKENSALSRQLINEATTRYGIVEGQLTLHQDRGSPMTAHGYLENMKELDITCSHSRPRVSNDNPFSESQFKTQKYQPDYPGRFNNIAQARQWCEDYFHWYNVKHHHSGLGGFTPEQVFTGQHHEVAKQKQGVLDKRFKLTPERFVKGRPCIKLPPTFVAINPIAIDEDTHSSAADHVNFPTLSAAGYVKDK